MPGRTAQLGDERLLGDKVAVVSGGGSGIGRGIAYTFTEAGARVVVADVDAETGDAAAAEVGGTFLRTDVSDPSQIRSTVDTVMRTLGRIDVLVNSAGVARYLDFFDVSPDDWDVINAVNARGTFFFMQAAARVMVRQESGAIVNISSVAGKGYPQTSSVAYAASKGAVITMTRTTAARLAPHNVRVNAICPGVTNTPMVARWRGANPQGSSDVIDAIPLRRANRVDDVANLALYLACDLAGTITGQSWNVDGGLVSD